MGNNIRWLRVTGLLLLLAVVAFGCRFVLDVATAAQPQHSVAINAAVIIVFAILLAFVVMPPLVRELGFKIVGRDVSADKNDESDQKAP